MPDRPTILVVDDDETIRDVLTMALEASYDVIVAKDGIEAVCVYERHVERINAIITDLDMPRLNGQAVAEWVHHIRPRLPVIIMSGSIRNVDLDGTLRSPHVKLLAKPFVPSQAEALLSSALRVRPRFPRTRPEARLEGGKTMSR